MMCCPFSSIRQNINFIKQLSLIRRMMPFIYKDPPLLNDKLTVFSFMICFPMGHDSGTKKVTKAANQCNRTSMEPLDEVDPFELVQFHLATVQALVPHKDIDFSRSRRSRVSNFGSYQKINGLASYLFLECATNQWLFESATAKANMKAPNLSGVLSSKFQLQQPSAILERR